MQRILRVGHLHNETPNKNKLIGIKNLDAHRF